jgi:hypothetical protein
MMFAFATSRGGPPYKRPSFAIINLILAFSTQGLPDLLRKTQAYLLWDSWQRPYVKEQPPVWFDEVFYQEGKPYRDREVQDIRELIGTK